MTTATKKWLLGLVAAIVAPVAIYWLTPPRDSNHATPAPGSSGEAQTYTWDGRVIDQAKQQLLSNVQVSLTVGTTTSTDSTDSEGRFIFVVSRSPGPVVAVLKAAAAGYQVFTRNVAAEASGMLEHQAEIPLVPLPPSTPPPSSPGTTPTSTLPKPKLMQSAAAVQYHPKSIDQAVRLIIPAGPPTQH